MKTVLAVDKIASVTRACGLKREVRVSAEIPCEEGVVVAVRVRNDKSAYSQLELPSGRMAQVKRGTWSPAPSATGTPCSATRGTCRSGWSPGDTVHLLNMGGVMGICDSVNPDLGPPFECEVLGAVLHFPYLGERMGGSRRGSAASRRPRGEPLDRGGPLGRQGAGARGGPGRLVHELRQDRRRLHPACATSAMAA